MLMLGYVHDNTTIWRFWDPRRRQVIQASNVTFAESEPVTTECQLVEDCIPEHQLAVHSTSEHQSVVDSLSECQSAVDLTSKRQLVVDSTLATQAHSDSMSSQISRRLDLGEQTSRGLDLAVKRYNLRKRPRAVAHRIRVEEEPMDSADPVFYRDAIAHPRLGQKWSDAVGEELQSLAENSTWDYIRLEDVPAGVTPISSKWVFRTKELPGGGIRYKARLVIRGFEQQAGIDYDETFTPVPKLQSLRMMLALVATDDWEIDQMDVVTAFLNPKVDCDVYMAQPEGIESGEPRVCKLRKSLYGLKQAPRLWYEHIDQFLRSLGLKR